MSRTWVCLLCALGCAAPHDTELETAARAGAALITAALELSVPRPSGTSTTPGAQRAPVLRQMAGMGTSYVVVWEDSRRGDIDVYSAIVDSNGTRVSGPTLIAGQAGDQDEVTLACGSSLALCFAAWVDESNGFIQGAQLDVDGKVVGNVRSLVARTLDKQHRPTIAWLTGDSYVVAWTESRNLQSDLFAAIVGANTMGPQFVPVPVEAAPLRLSRTPSLAIGRNAGMPTPAAFLVWEETGLGVVGTRLDANTLVPLDVPPHQISVRATLTDGGVGWPVVEPLTAAFQIVWAERHTDWDLYGATFTADAGLSVSRALSPTAGDQTAPALSGAFVAWTDSRNGQLDLYGSLISGNTILQDSPIFLQYGDQELPSVRSEANTGLIVWTDGRGLDGQPDIYGGRLSVPPTATVSGSLITGFPPEAQTVAVASQRAVQLVVWEDSRDPNGSLDVYGLFVLDARPDAGFPVATGMGPQGQPAVAAGNGEFLVVFADGPSRQIRSVRVNQSAVVPMPTSVTTPAAGVTHAQPAVVWTGAHYAIFYTEQPAGRVRSAVVASGGTLVQDFVVGGSGGMEGQPAAAAAQSTGIALVAWAEKNGNGYDVYARRFNPSGMQAETVALPIAIAAGDQVEPAVGTDGQDFFVVWRDTRGLGGGDLWGLRVPATGPIVDVVGVQLTDGPGIERRPGVAFDGKDWVVTWEDLRELPAAVWAERVAADLSHYAPELVTSGIDPAIAIGSQSMGLIAYHRVDGTPPARQVFMKPVLAPAGTSCTSGASCQSGVCSMGMCGAVDGGSVKFDAGVMPIDAGVLPIPPEIKKDAEPTAQVGVAYAYNKLRRISLERGTPPVAFGTCDTPPDGFVVDSASGDVTWTPKSAGPQAVCVFATNGPTDEYRFDVTVSAASGQPSPPGPTLNFHTQSCECGTSGGLLAFTALFSLFSRRTRRRG